MINILLFVFITAQAILSWVAVVRMKKSIEIMNNTIIKIEVAIMEVQLARFRLDGAKDQVLKEFTIELKKLAFNLALLGIKKK
jgi:hypothetical protein